MSSDAEALANSAFCSAVLCEAVSGYCKENEEGMELGALYLVLPLVLPGNTRDALPNSVSTALHSWVKKNPGARIRFPASAKSLVHRTQMGIQFMLTHEVAHIYGTRLLPGPKKLLKGSWENQSEESKSCMKKATLVGKMIARSGDLGTTFMLLGVRP
jgi:hypothetical protein